MSPLLYDTLAGPIEIGEGRGDLRYSSVPFGTQTTSIALAGGRTISYAKLFATQPWVAAAVMRMMTWASKVPLKLYERTGDDSRRRLRPDDHPLAEAIEQPWDGGSRVDLVTHLLGPLLVHGNSLVEVDEGRSGRIRFETADWRYVKPIKPWRDRVSGWTLDHDDPTRERTLSADQTLHVRWWSPDGPLGVSPLSQLGTTLRIEEAAQKWQKSIFDNAARPPSAIMASTEFLGLEREKRKQLLDNLRKDVDEMHAGVENAGRPAVLPPGLEWKPVGHSAVEAELISQRKVAREEIAAVYLIPPGLVGIMESMNYSSLRAVLEIAYTDTIGPPLVLIEASINAQIVRRLRAPDLFVEFDFGPVLRGDRVKEIAALRSGIGTGLYSVNEGRRALNMPPSKEKDADALWLPTNNLTKLGSSEEDEDEGADDEPEDEGEPEGEPEGRVPSGAPGTSRGS